MSIEENVITLTSADSILPELDFPKVSQQQLAWRDVVDGFEKWRIWTMLAYQDIKLRYRRSVLGPFWLTLSMAITVYSMGFLYAKLFRTNLSEYYPFLVAGMLAWSLISSIVIEATDGFILQENLIKQIKLPYTLYIHRLVSRNILIFFHNVFVIIPVIIIFHETVKINWYTLLLIPGLLITYLNGWIYGTLLSMLGSRFRDISQVIRSLVQVVFFITPVMWNPNILTGRSYFFVDYNPFYGFVECIRMPLLGVAPTSKNIISVLIVTITGLLITSKLFIRYRSRIVYWL